MKQTHLKKQSAPHATLVNRIQSIDSIKLFYISIIVLVLAIISLMGAIIIQHRSPKQQHAPIPVSGYGVNTPISMGIVTMEVTKVSFSDGQPGFKSPSDMHYVIVDFTVKNNADHPIDVLPSSDTYVKNQVGTVSYLTPFALQQPFHAGAVLPGEQIKGQLSYIAAKTGTLKLFVDSIWSGGVVPFKVQ